MIDNSLLCIDSLHIEIVYFLVLTHL